MDSHLKGNIWSKLIIILLIALIVAGGATAQFSHHLQSITKHVVLVDDGYRVEITTYDKTVNDVLERYDIVLRPGDEIFPGPDEFLERETEITITRAMSVTVMADGEEQIVYLAEGTVQDVLQIANVELREQDTINYRLTDEVVPQANILINRMDDDILIETEAIPYQVLTRTNNNMDEGVDRVVQEGQQGELQRRILVLYRDGIEIERRLQEEIVAVEPLDRIVEKGTIKNFTNSRGTVIRYSDTRKMTATAYTLSVGCTGKDASHKNYGITANGSKVKPHHTIAAPRGIPFGTKVYIPELVIYWRNRGVEISGIFVVEDRGGAITGSTIDIYMEDLGVARHWGRRSVTVYFIK